jgi:hypothetical protein
MLSVDFSSRINKFPTTFAFHFMGQSVRKSVAQVGVLLYVSTQFGIPFLAPVLPFAVLVLLVAAILPASDQDSWGSMWPLVGYDNAIDAIYSRGPWLVRYQELDEAEVERGITEGMVRLFAQD